MKLVASVLAGIGVLAIVVAGFGVAFLFEFDFVADELPWLLTLIIGGIVVGLIFIAIAAVVGAKYNVVTFSGFRANRAGGPVDPSAEEKL